jgi:hypothetical protein
LFGKIFGIAKRWWILIAGALFLFLIILFFPFQSTIVPPWRLRIVDDAGAQVAGVNVTEHWQHYLLETEGHEAMLVTDERGRVDFPARTIRGSITARMLNTIGRLASRGSNARSDPYASIVVWGSRDYETGLATYQPGTAPQADIVIQRHR